MIRGGHNSEIEIAWWASARKPPQRTSLRKTSPLGGASVVFYNATTPTRFWNFCMQLGSSKWASCFRTSASDGLLLRTTSHPESVRLLGGGPRSVTGMRGGSSSVTRTEFQSRCCQGYRREPPNIKQNIVRVPGFAGRPRPSDGTKQIQSGGDSAG